MGRPPKKQPASPIDPAKKTSQKQNTEAGKPPKLTMKQRKLVKGIAAGKTQREAARQAGMNEQYVSDVLKKPEIQASIQDLMAKHGLDDASLLNVHRELIHATKVISAVGGKEASGETVDFIDVPDHQARAKGLEMAYKLKGAFLEKKEVSFPDGLPNIKVIFGDEDD